MNAKYYPALRPYAVSAQKVLSIAPHIAKLKGNKPSDILMPVYNVLADELGNDDKDYALEVAKMIFYGYHVEVNAYYNK